MLYPEICSAPAFDDQDDNRFGTNLSTAHISKPQIESRCPDYKPSRLFRHHVNSGPQVDGVIADASGIYSYVLQAEARTQNR